MQTTQQDRDRREPGGGRPSGSVRPGGPGTPVGRAGRAGRPVVAALVVLMLWCAWLLVPDPARRDLLGSSTPSAALSGAGPGSPPAPAGAGTDRSSRSGQDGATAPGRRAPVVPAGDTPGATADPGQDPAPSPADGTPAVQVPQRGTGAFVVTPGSGTPVGDGRLVRYSVEVEGGVPLDPAEVAGVVEGILADPRSWTGDGRWALQRTDADPDVRIRVASPDTADALCAPLRTNGELSCRNGPDVVLNALRWTRGASSWGADVDGYRQYLVNHELGHFLGHGHVPCPSPGEPAPVMLQQTLGLQGCAPNAWPFP